MGCAASEEVDDGFFLKPEFNTQQNQLTQSTRRRLTVPPLFSLVVVSSGWCDDVAGRQWVGHRCDDLAVSQGETWAGSVSGSSARNKPYGCYRSSTDSKWYDATPSGTPSDKGPECSSSYSCGCMTWDLHTLTIDSGKCEDVSGRHSLSSADECLAYADNRAVSGYDGGSAAYQGPVQGSSAGSNDPLGCVRGGAASSDTFRFYSGQSYSGCDDNYVCEWDSFTEDTDWGYFLINGDTQTMTYSECESKCNDNSWCSAFEYDSNSPESTYCAWWKANTCSDNHHSWYYNSHYTTCFKVPSTSSAICGTYGKPCVCKHNFPDCVNNDGKKINAATCVCVGGGSNPTNPTTICSSRTGLVCSKYRGCSEQPEYSTTLQMKYSHAHIESGNCGDIEGRYQIGAASCRAYGLSVGETFDESIIKSSSAPLGCFKESGKWKWNEGVDGASSGSCASAQGCACRLLSLLFFW